MNQERLEEIKVRLAQLHTRRYDLDKLAKFAVNEKDKANKEIYELQEEAYAIFNQYMLPKEKNAPTTKADSNTEDEDE